MKRSLLCISLMLFASSLYSQIYEYTSVIKTGYGIETGGVGAGYELIMDSLNITYGLIMGIGYFEDNLGLSAGAKIYFIRTDHFNMSLSGNYGVVDLKENDTPDYGMFSMIGSSYLFENGIYLDAAAGLIPRGNASGEMTYFNPTFQMSAGFSL